VAKAVKVDLAAVLWAVAIWRLPSARQETWRRALWLALTTLAAGYTLTIPPVIHAVDAATGVTSLAVLAKHVATIVSCAAVLEWVSALTQTGAQSGERRAQRRRWALAACAAAVMAVLFAFIDRQETDDFTRAMAGNPAATVYLLVFQLYLGLAMGQSAALFTTAARRKPTGLLRWGLYCLAAGTTSGLVYALGRVMFLLASLRPSLTAAAERLLQVTDHLQLVAIALILLGTCLPAASSALTTVGGNRALNTLRPLWQDLTGSAPHVVLGAPPGRRSDALAVTDLRHRLLRRTTEIRDASQLLCGYLTDQQQALARTHLAAEGFTGEQLDAAAEAVELRTGLRAKASGASPQAVHTRQARRGGANLDGEVRWLCLVADSWHDPAVTQVTDHLADRPATEDRP
jgi:uncharacterized protein DUF6545